MDKKWLPALAIGVAFLAVIVVKQTPRGGEPVNEVALPESAGTPAEQAVAAAEGLPVFLCFRSGVTQPGHCVPCREMARITTELTPRYEGRVAFVDVSLDSDTVEQRLIEGHEIQVMPTNVLLDRDRNLVEKRIGVWPVDELTARLDDVSR